MSAYILRIAYLLSLSKVLHFIIELTVFIMQFKPEYRLYVDEVGNPDLKASRNPNHRYLSLTGIILKLDYVEHTVFPALEELKKRHLGPHPDDWCAPLHRREIINKIPPFEKLREPVIEREFDADLLRLLETLDYVVITVVIDKLEHLQRYKVWHFDPYHYSLSVLVERYVLWMQSKNTRGDVMVESRGGKEDMRLKNSFVRFYQKGTDYLGAEKFSQRLTSKQLKVKSKSNNISGLQLADVIAHPSFSATLARKNNESLAENFGSKIAEILERSKYYRNPQGRIRGWGRKWLP